MHPLDALRNMNLNAAYWPKRPIQDTAFPTVDVPQGNTMFDPLMGTGWDKWLDAAGASQPGGIKMGGQLGNAAIGGLQRALPMRKQSGM